MSKNDQYSLQQVAGEKLREEAGVLVASSAVSKRSVRKLVILFRWIPKLSSSFPGFKRQYRIGWVPTTSAAAAAVVVVAVADIELKTARDELIRHDLFKRRIRP